MREKPQLIGCRIYKRHRKLLAQLARRKKVSQAEIVRRAIENYAHMIPEGDLRDMLKVKSAKV